VTTIDPPACCRHAKYRQSRKRPLDVSATIAESWKLAGGPHTSLTTIGAENVLAPSVERIIQARRRSRAGRLSVKIVEYCPHAACPPSCWCRKPLPRLGVVFVHRHRLDLTQCIYVGAGPQDRAFARRLGFQYSEANDFFAL